VAKIRADGSLSLLGARLVPWREAEALVFHRRQTLPGHPNGMRFTAYDAEDQPLTARVYYSVGGGFVVDEQAAAQDRIVEDRTPLPHPFTSGAELL
jgi:L-serine dehydratase